MPTSITSRIAALSAPAADGRRRLAFVLVLALFLGAWVESGHLADIEAHDEEGVCATCLFAGSPGHGLSASLSVWGSFLPAAAPATYRSSSVFSSLSHSKYAPRAPPRIS